MQMQPMEQVTYPTRRCSVPRLRCDGLLRRLQPYMVKANRFLKDEMVRLTNQKTGRCARWGALVVLVAICSLTIHVATRYNSAATPAAPTITTLHKHSVQEPRRQSLTLDAANWIPPVVTPALLYAPSIYSRVAITGPTVPNPSFESSLYYRPPPVLRSL